MLRAKWRDVTVVAMGEKCVLTEVFAAIRRGGGSFTSYFYYLQTIFCTGFCAGAAEQRATSHESASSRSQHSRFKQQQRGKVTSSSNSSNDVE